MNELIRTAVNRPAGADERDRLIQFRQLDRKRFKCGFRAAVYGVQARKGKEDS